MGSPKPNPTQKKKGPDGFRVRKKSNPTKVNSKKNSPGGRGMGTGSMCFSLFFEFCIYEGTGGGRRGGGGGGLFPPSFHNDYCN